MRRSLASLVVAFFALVIPMTSAMSAASASVPSVAVGQAASLPAGTVQQGLLAPSTPLDLTVTLNPSDPTGLSAFALAVSTPGSRQYRHFLTTSQFASEFGASQTSIDSVTSWVQSQHLTATDLSPNHLSIDVSGTAGAVESALGTSLENLVLPGGRHVFANTSPPLLPAAIAPDVQSLLGLDDLAQITPPDPATQPEVSNTATSCAPISGVTPPNVPAYTPTNLAQAYDFTGLSALGDTGTGQRVAVIEDGSFSPQDIKCFQSHFATVATINKPIIVDQSPGTGPEAALDIETIASLAPKATIDVYETTCGTSCGTDLYDTYSRAVTDDEDPVISISLAVCEQNWSSYLTAENTVFEEAVSQGQEVLAASGDDGSEGCYKQGDTKSLAVEDPASQPFVTGVGGTSLNSISPPTGACQPF